MKTEKNEEIVICYRCHGLGVIITQELEDYHRGKYNSIEEPCKECDGKGRLKMNVTTKYSKI